MKNGVNLNDAQKAAISEALPAYRRILVKAYSGTSKAAAIKGFCLRCVGYLRNEVRDCTAYACPLHPYRPYQDDTEEEP